MSSSAAAPTRLRYDSSTEQAAVAASASDLTTTNHFDLVVLGTDLAGLVTAALAARRGKRVVVLPQGPADSRVQLGGREWRLDDAPLLSLSSPFSRRIFEELGMWAQIQRQRRRVPGHLHFALGGTRLDLHEGRSLAAEALAAWPDAPIDPALERLEEAVERADGVLDELLESDAVMSPSGFWARRFLSKAAGQLRELTGDPLAPLPDEHPLRRLASASLPWVQHLKPALLGQGVALRLAARFLFGPEDHAGGFSDLRARLIEVIKQRSGEIKSHVRVAELLVKRGRIAGLGLLGKNERYGCEHLVVASDPRRMIDAGLLPGSLPRPLETALHEVRPFAYRWLLHVELPDLGLSPAFDGCAVVVDDTSSERGGLDNIFVRRRPAGEGRSRVTITRIVPPDQVHSDLRADTLERLHRGGVLPFIHDHVELAYSPHDGRGATDGHGRPLDDLGPESARSVPMASLYETPHGSMLGVGLLPLDSGIKNLTFASRLTYPGLGLEGELLAGAAAAARVVPLPASRAGLFGRLGGGSR